MNPLRPDWLSLFRMQRTPRLAGALLLIAAGFLIPYDALAGSPRVSFVYPAAGQRGTEAEVTFKGSNLSDAHSILFDSPGFHVAPVKAEAGQFIAKIRIDPDVQQGEHRCRVITKSGVADLRCFFVTPFPLVEESKTKSTERAPQRVPLNSTVVGKTPGDEQDFYSFEIAKGERLSIEVVGLQLHTQNPYDPEIAVLTPDGSTLDSLVNTVFNRGSPVLTAIAPQSGLYKVRIRDTTGSGLGECHYLLHIGSFPRPVTSLPLGGPSGVNTRYELLGDSKGQAKTTASQSLQDDSFGTVFPQSEFPAPTPVPVRVSNLPNVLDPPPAKSPSEAAHPPIMLPAALNGIISAPGQSDFFRFTAKKGAILEFKVFARALRSPIDSVIDLYDAKGARIAGNDDNAFPDSFLKWTAPADGEFVLGIRDQQNRGGPLFTYRIEVAPPSPKLKIALPEMVINSSQERRAIVIPKGNRYASLVRIKREDWSGAVEILAPNLPGDVVASCAPIEKAFDTVAMLFEASSAAPNEHHLIELGARSLEPANAPTPAVRMEHKVDVTENANRRPFYSTLESKVPIAITDPIPVRIDVETAKMAIVRSGQLALKVRITRSDEFKGPLELALLHVPQGIGTSGTIKVPAGANEATVILNANTDAPLKTWRLCVVGNAEFTKGPVWFSTGLFELEVSEPPFSGTLMRCALTQNGSAQMRIKLEPKSPFDGKAKLQLVGLPVGVSADPVEVSADATEALFHVKAAPTAALGLSKQVVAQCSHEKGGSTVTAVLARGGVLRVDKSDPTPTQTAALPPPPAAPPAAPPASPQNP